MPGRRLVCAVKRRSAAHRPACNAVALRAGPGARTVARDLDFLRDEERAPLAYDDARHGFRLTDSRNCRMDSGHKKKENKILGRSPDWVAEQTFANASRLLAGIMKS